MDSTIVPAWMFSMLERIQRSQHAEVELVVLPPRMPPGKQRPRKLSISAFISHSLARIYDWIEWRRSGGFADAFAPRDCSQLLGDARRLHDDSPGSDPSDHLSEADIDVVLESRLDVLLDLGSRAVDARLLALPPDGV